MEFTVTIASAHPEDDSWMFLDFGASATEELASGAVRCIVEGSPDRFIERVREAGLEIIETKALERRNWVQECEAVWKPLEVGTRTITPVMSAETLPTLRREGEIFIIPGEGFGTGHHESTRLAIGFIEHAAVCAARPKRIIDVGTGSGILAMAASQIHDTPVRGIDIDEASIRNARENASLNGLEERLDLSTDSFESIDSEFDLILANIYAEVLCGYASTFTARLAPDGFLILSGIMNSLLESVRTAFPARQWEEIRWGSEGNWSALLLRRRVTAI